MSGKERRRMTVLQQVKEKKLSVVAAAGAMNVSYRQAKRIWQRFAKAGAGGLIHKSRGRPGPRRRPESFRRKVLARVLERYRDFGPTLAAEYLAQDGMVVDHETLRRWLVAQGRWVPGRPRRAHRAWRERRECFGQMVQMDGSDHDWFEGRRERAVLMVLIDDATNCTYAQFFEGETTRACYDALEGWIRRHGVPASLYVDRDSIYRCERAPTAAEEIAQVEPRTQFGRAMEQLGVELILANSPQAKGRVERRNGVLQDRLVKALRLEGISDLKQANEFLAKKFLPQFNERFCVPARAAADAHRAAPSQGKLDAIFSWEKERRVANDWTVRWAGQWLQIAREHEPMNLAGKQVTIREHRDGRLEALRGSRLLQSKMLPARPTRSALPGPGRGLPPKPTSAHPWRRWGVAFGKEHVRQEKKEGAVVKRARLLAAAASGQPLLRSGFPPAAAARRKENQTKGDIFT